MAVIFAFVSNFVMCNTVSVSLNHIIIIHLIVDSSISNHSHLSMALQRIAKQDEEVSERIILCFVPTQHFSRFSLTWRVRKGIGERQSGNFSAGQGKKCQRFFAHVV